MRKKLFSVFLLTISMIFLLGSCSTKEKQATTTIQYSAAASLKDGLTEIKEKFQEKHPEINLLLDFGGSGAIREKVINGAPIDGVLLASKKDTDTLLEKKKLRTTHAALKNTLVLITNKKNPLIGDLPTVLNKVKKIAIGNPDTVPAGNYAKETLHSLGLEKSLADKLVQGSDVKQVLSYVEAGNADCGFVYQTDALLSPKVQIIQEISENLHSEILYYTGTIRDTKYAQEVDTFNDYILSKDGTEILKKYGFSVMNK